MNNWIKDKLSVKSILLFSKISLDRNINNSLFTDMQNLEEARKNVDVICNSLLDNTEYASLDVYKFWETDYKFITSFESKFLSTKELRKREDRSALILNKEETMGIMINELNHIRMFGISSDLDLMEIFNKINIMDDYLEERIEYAFHEEFGYLTATDERIGTGLKISVALHLPAISYKKDNLSNIKIGLEEGIDLNELKLFSDYKGVNLYEVTNKVTIGISEDEIIRRVIKSIDFIIKSEIEERERILKKYPIEIEDKVSRAIAIIKSAKLMSYRELVELNSTLRFAMEVSFLEIDKDDLNNLLVCGSDNMIDLEMGEGLSLRERNKHRAYLARTIVE